jgi:tol-pal system-associated acyl-CoA thioesterase
MDTDQGGVVHHAAYLRYMEAARVELLRARGIDYRRFEQEIGKGLPVAEVRVRYKKPARFDDELSVETTVGELNRAKLRFDYRIWRGDEIVCEAQITCACVLLAEGRLCSMDERIRSALA